MAYTRINWQDLPSTATPRNATNLNKMDSAIKEHDDKLLGNTSMGNVVVDSITSKNIISGWNVGWINNNTGADEADSTARRTNYMNVDFSTSTNYKLSGLQISHCRMFIAAYNVNKQFLGRSDQYTNSTTTNITLSSTSFTNGTPQGTGAIKYLRIVLYTPDSGYTIDGIISSSNMQLEKGSTATTYAPYQNLNAPYYEEGTFTPIIQGRTTAGTATYSIRNGHYTKIGKVIFFEFQIGCTLTGSAGIIYITGMPNLANANEPSLALVTISPSFDSNRPMMQLRKYYDGVLIDYGNLGSVENQNWSSTKYLYGSGFYILQ